MVLGTFSEPASQLTIDIAPTSPNLEGSRDHAAEPLTPSSMGSPVRRKSVSCDHCRQRHRRCIHDGHGNIDPSRATKAKTPAAPPANKTTLSKPSSPREISFHGPNIGPVSTDHTWESVHDSPSVHGWEGFGGLKILDPEEDLTIRPHFPGRGPFGRLTEALESERVVTGNPDYRTPVSRKRAHGGGAMKAAIKKELPISEGNITVGAPYIALDLSDEDFSSPRSRKHKLTARKTTDRSQLSIISSKEARPEKHTGGSNRNAQNLFKAIATMNSCSKGSTSFQQGSEIRQYSSSGDLLSTNKWPVSAKGKESSQIQQTVTADTPLLTTEPFWPEKHKRSLALAAEKALFENPFNAIRKIFTTEILTFLNETSSYEDLCKRFESKRFRVDRVLLAQRLLAEVPDMHSLAHFSQSNAGSVPLENEGRMSTDQQRLDQDPCAQMVDAIPQSIHQLANSGLTSEAAKVDSVEAVPRLRAPVANMTFRSLPSEGIHDGSFSYSPNAGDTHVANGEPFSVAPKHPLQNSTGIDPELVSSTLFQMENIIRSQKQREELSTCMVSGVSLNPAEQAEKAKKLEAQKNRDAILRDEARRILGNSRSVFKNQSGSQEHFKDGCPSQDITNPVSRSGPQIGVMAIPNTNSSEDPTGLQNEPLSRSPSEERKYSRIISPELGGSDLFLPDFEPAVVREGRIRSTPEPIAFGKWANCKGEARSVLRTRTLEGPPTLLDFFTLDKRPEIIARTRTKTTLEEGHFARHQERKKALVEVARRQKFSDGDRFGDQDGFDGQEVDIDAVADAYERANRARPTTGGKGISKATMSQWNARTAEGADFDISDSDSDEDALGEPEVLYQYHVHKREWLKNQNESDAPVQVLGPYYTMAEANAVAAVRVKKPTQENSARIFRPGAWSYSYSKDDHGMETHVAGSGGGSIEASVSRIICPPDKETRLPAGVFTIPRVVYLAMFQPLSLVSTDSVDALFGDMQPDQSTAPTRTLATTLKACTTLHLANKAAGQKWLELQTKDFLDDTLDNLKRARLETYLRKDCRRMEEQNVSFDRTYCDERSGEKTHVWVEMVDIEGPRN